MKLNLNKQFTTPNGTCVIISGLGKGIVTVSDPSTGGIVRRQYQHFLVDIVTGTLKVAQ